MCLCVVQIPVLIKILWNWWVPALIFVSFNATCQETLYTAAWSGGRVCSGGAQTSVFGFSPLSLSTSSQSFSKYVLREQSVKAPSLRCKAKRQNSKFNVYLLCSNMPFFSFLPCFHPLVFVHVMIIFMSALFPKGEQFMYQSGDNVVKCFPRCSAHSWGPVLGCAQSLQNLIAMPPIDSQI